MNSQVTENTGTYRNAPPAGTHLGTLLSEPEAENVEVSDNDLQYINYHWDSLPEYIRQTIKAIIKSTVIK